MTAHAQDSSLPTPDDTPVVPSGDAAEKFALLCRLESSLKSSHQAVLSRDIAQLQGLTGEQQFLLHQLSRLCPRHPSPSKQPVQRGLACQPAPEISDDSSLSALIQQAQTRILHLGRVQCALLSRAQQRLRALSNRHAGLETTYTLFPGSDHVVLRQATQSRARG